MSIATNETAPSDNQSVPIQHSDIQYRKPGELKPYPGNARVHDEKQIAALMASVSEFGFQGVIIISEDDIVLAGHGRLEAAKRLKLETVPVRVAIGLSPKQQRAYVLTDNKMAQMSKWDHAQLKAEIEILLAEDFAVELTGFGTDEIDLMLDDTPATVDPGDMQPEDIPEEAPVTKAGDLFVLGDHRLYCGSALDKAAYDRLMQGKLAQQCITDPPYNVPVNGHVCGSGKKKHAEFKMASGEMSSPEFIVFLRNAFDLIAAYAAEGAIIMSYMDWRHQREIQEATEPVFGPQKQLCVWVKDMRWFTPCLIF